MCAAALHTVHTVLQTNFSAAGKGVQCACHMQRLQAAPRHASIVFLISPGDICKECKYLPMFVFLLHINLAQNAFEHVLVARCNRQKANGGSRK